MKYILSFALLLSCTTGNAQLLTTLPDGGNPKAMVSENVGLTRVTIDYSRPSVKGREGKIWGDLVPEGFADQGTGTPIPWRAGANENTTIEFSNEVRIENTTVPAGKYALFIAYGPNESTIILSKNNSSWGSFYYNEKEDVARIKVKPVKQDWSTEFLTYGFTRRNDSSATVALSWEKLSLPFTITTELQKQQVAIFNDEMRTLRGFYPLAQVQYADYMMRHDINLDDALDYATAAANAQPGFRSYMVKSGLLYKKGKAKEADEAMQSAIQYSNPAQVYYYGMGMIDRKEKDNAMKLFKLNAGKNPKNYMAHMGMAKAYVAMGDNKQALASAKTALTFADKDDQKKQVNAMISEMGTKAN